MPNELRSFRLDSTNRERPANIPAYTATRIIFPFKRINWMLDCIFLINEMIKQLLIRGCCYYMADLCSEYHKTKEGG